MELGEVPEAGGYLWALVPEGSFGCYNSLFSYYQGTGVVVPLVERAGL